MKVTCKVCNTTKNIKEEKLEPYRGKIISTKCANKQCTHRIKFKVPLKEKNKEPEIVKTKSTKQKELKQIKVTPKKLSKPTVKDEKQLSCPNCYAEITKDTKFCMKCGHKIVKSPTTTKIEVVKCVNCDRIYEEGENFCLKCGTSKELKSAEPESKPITKKPSKNIGVKEGDTSKMLIAQNQMANPTTIWLLFVFLGWSYGSMGNIGLQILYYITLGGFGIWALVRLFTLNGAIKSYNKQICMKSGLSADEMKRLGVL